jgi:hypothetical protein
MDSASLRVNQTRITGNHQQGGGRLAPRSNRASLDAPKGVCGIR